MKKLVVGLLTIVACKAYALPIGNPAGASLLCNGIFLGPYDWCNNNPWEPWLHAASVRIGFYGDYVFNRHMQLDAGHADDKTQHTQISTNAGYIAFNIWDRFDLFATFGATDLYVSTVASSFARGGAATDGLAFIETDTDFSWSAGARGTMWDLGGFTVGCEVQYLYTKPAILRLTDHNDKSVYPNHLVKAKYFEWQAGIGVAYRINMFVPYLGMKWGNAQILFGRAVVDFDTGYFRLENLEASKSWGYAVGVTIVGCSWASVNTEVRFGDEKALCVNGQIRF